MARCLCAVSLAACVTRLDTPRRSTLGLAPEAAPVPSRGCILPNAVRWPSTGEQRRTVLVWLDAASASQDIWALTGRARLRDALERWNATGIPIRLALAPSRAAATINVEIIDRFPAGQQTGHSSQAGVTHLTYADGGEITSAVVLVAERTPGGVRYSVADQEAILLHELGHAIGLPHSAGRYTLMSPRPIVSTVTAADIAMARALYLGQPCSSVQSVTAIGAARDKLRP